MVSSEDSLLLRGNCLTLAKWFSLPRLETRTKEFNICASIGVSHAPVRNESNSGCHSPPAPILRENGLSVSTHVETRKMVNYA